MFVYGYSLEKERASARARFFLTFGPPKREKSISETTGGRPRTRTGDVLDIVSSCVRETLYCDYTLWYLVSYKSRETRRSHRVQMSDFSFFFHPLIAELPTRKAGVQLDPDA